MSISTQVASRPLVKVIVDTHGPVALIVFDPKHYPACDCGHVMAFGKNRDGRTRCVECDSRYTTERKRMGFLGPGVIT